MNIKRNGHFNPLIRKLFMHVKNQDQEYQTKSSSKPLLMQFQVGSNSDSNCLQYLDNTR